VRRREFITGIGAAGAWPIVARAQQKSMPVIGFLGIAEPGVLAMVAFRQGLRDLGYVEGSNVLIEYRWAEGKLERLPVLAAELVALKVDVIVTAGGTESPPRQASDDDYPIVFGVVGDPIAEGLVNAARPGGNVTGLSTSPTI
jgi:putative ABC transport system substrate-binding protein